MNAKKAKRLRRNAAELARQLAERNGTKPGACFSVTVERERRRKQDQEPAKRGRSAQGKGEGITAVWLGARRIYKLAKRAAQTGRPRPQPSGWFHTAIRKGLALPPA